MRFLILRKFFYYFIWPQDLPRFGGFAATLEGRLVGTADHFARKNGVLPRRRMTRVKGEDCFGGEVQAVSCPHQQKGRPFRDAPFVGADTGT